MDRGKTSTPSCSSTSIQSLEEEHLRQEHQRGVSIQNGDLSNAPPAATFQRHYLASRLNSSLSVVPRRYEYDDSLVHRAIRDAGRWAYGIVLVEMWVLNEDRTCLFRPDSAWWCNPSFHPHPGVPCEKDCKVCSLLNTHHKSAAPPDPVSLGEGLPGALWAETKSWLHGARSVSLLGTSHRAREGHISDITGEIFPTTILRRDIVWRQVRAIADDPDQPWNHRLHVLASAGLGWAAAVPFSLHGQKGIVVYMARDGVDLNHLQSHTNQAYLKAAADFAGAAYALRRPRYQMERERYRERVAAWRRVRNKILALKTLNITLKELVDVNSGQHQQEQQEEPLKEEALEELQVVTNLFKQLCPLVKARVWSILRKSRGGGSQPPPVFSWKQSFQTFIGVFCTVLMVARLNEAFLSDFGPDYEVILGPFGALVALLYGLSAAPASQPRNAMVGQAVAMTTAMMVSYCKGTIQALWMRQALSTALAIAAMVKIGVIHPPAGASALIFSSGDYGWTHVMTYFVGMMIALVSATLINNASEKRQYPMYWAFGFNSATPAT